MEKRKDIDMLRFYGGDIHQKNKEGEYVITNNLVNPKNKEDMNNNMWKEDYHEYVEWKNNLHSYLKLIYSDMWYGEREK